MELNRLNLPNKLNIFLVLVDNLKFLVFNDTEYTKYINVPLFSVTSKESNLLSLKNPYEKDKKEAEKKAEFNQSFNRLDFGLEHLTTIFKKKLILKGLGYKMLLKKDLKIVKFKLGFSHQKILDIPENVRIRKTKKFINIESQDQVLLGNFTNRVVELKSDDCYKVKGFLYKYEKKKLKVVKKK